MILSHFQCTGVLVDKGRESGVVDKVEKRDGLKITTRLPAPYGEWLREGARKAKCRSAHDYARLLIVRQLENADVLDLLDEIRTLRRELSELRQEILPVSGRKKWPLAGRSGG